MHIVLGIIALFVALYVFGTLLMFLELLGEKCSDCGSRKTWTWRHETSDASYSHIKHVNTNRYCFSCCDFTARDDYAILMGGDLRHDPFYKIATRHKNEHNPPEQTTGIDFQSPNCTIKIEGPSEE